MSPCTSHLGPHFAFCPEAVLLAALLPRLREHQLSALVGDGDENESFLRCTEVSEG